MSAHTEEGTGLDAASYRFARTLGCPRNRWGFCDEAAGRPCTCTRYAAAGIEAQLGPNDGLRPRTHGRRRVLRSLERAVLLVWAIAALMQAIAAIVLLAS